MADQFDEIILPPDAKQDDGGFDEVILPPKDFETLAPEDHEKAMRNARLRLSIDPADAKAHAIADIHDTLQQDHGFELKPPQGPDFSINVPHESKDPTSVSIDKQGEFPDITMGLHADEDPALDDYISSGQKLVSKINIARARAIMDDVTHRGTSMDVETLLPIAKLARTDPDTGKFITPTDSIESFGKQMWDLAASTFSRSTPGEKGAAGIAKELGLEAWSGVKRMNQSMEESLKADEASGNRRGSEREMPQHKFEKSLVAGGAGKAAQFLTSTAANLESGVNNLASTEDQIALSDAEKAIRLGKTNSLIDDLVKKGGGDPDSAEAELGGIVAQGLIPMGVAGKTSGLISKAADKGVDLAIQGAGATIEGAAKVAKSKTGQIATALITHNPKLAATLLMEAAAEKLPRIYGISVGDFIRSSRSRLMEATLGKVQQLGADMRVAGGEGESISEQAIKRGEERIRSNTAQVNSIASKSKTPYVMEHGESGDFLHPDDSNLFSKEEQEIRKLQRDSQKVKAGMGRLKVQSDAEKAAIYLTKNGIAIGGMIAENMALGGIIGGINAQPGDNESAKRTAVMMGMFAAPFAPMGAASGLKAIRAKAGADALASLGKDWIGKDHPEYSEHMSVYNSLSPEAQKRIDILNGTARSMGGQAVLVPKEIMEKTNPGSSGYISPDGKTFYIRSDFAESGTGYHEVSHLLNRWVGKKAVDILPGLKEKLGGEGSEAYQEFEDYYNSLGTTEKANIPDEVFAEIGRKVLTDMPPELFYGGESGADVLKRWGGNMVQKIAPQWYAKNKIDSVLKAPMSPSDMDAVKSHLFKMGEAASELNRERQKPVESSDPSSATPTAPGAEKRAGDGAPKSQEAVNFTPEENQVGNDVFTLMKAGGKSKQADIRARVDQAMANLKERGEPIDATGLTREYTKLSKPQNMPFARDYTPALQAEEGKRFIGMPGQTHDDIYKSQPDPLALRAEDPAHGFVDREGNFKTRDEVGTALGQFDKNGKVIPMTSEILRDLQKKELDAHEAGGGKIYQLGEPVTGDVSKDATLVRPDMANFKIPEWERREIDGLQGGKDVYQAMHMPIPEGKYKEMVNSSMDRMLKLIDTGIYKDRDLNIISRELLQNGVDAFKGQKGDKKIDEFIDSKNNVYAFSDSGKGMTAQIMLDKYLPPITSGKDIGEGGGLGLAKGVVLGRPKEFKVSSVAVDGDKTYQITLTGTGEGWKQYAKDFILGKLDPESFSPDFQKLELNDNLKLSRVEVPEGTPTGTTYALRDDSFSYNSSPDKFRVLEKSFKPRTIDGRGKGNEFFDKLGESTDSMRPPEHRGSTIHETPFGNQFDKLDNPHYSIELLNNPDVPPAETGAVKMHVLSNGSYQFTKEMSVGNWGDQAVVPKEMVMDIKPKVAADDANYPFTISRDEVKNSVLQDIRKAFAESVRKSQESVKTAYEKSFTEEPVRTSKGHRVSNFFSELKQEDFRELEKTAPVMNVLADAVNSIFPKTNQALVSALGESGQSSSTLAAHSYRPDELVESIQKAVPGGLTTHPGVFGVNIFNPKEGRYESFINPFSISKAADSIAHHAENTDALENILARLVVDVASHEVTHNMVRDEDRDLSRAFTFMKSREAAHLVKEVEKLTRELYRQDNLEEQISNLADFNEKLKNYDTTTEVKIFDSGKERSDWSLSALRAGDRAETPGSSQAGEANQAGAGNREANGPTVEQHMPAHIEKEAQRLGLEYRGPMGDGLLLFHDPITKTSITVKEDASRGDLQEKLADARLRHNSPDKMDSMPPAKSPIKRKKKTTRSLRLAIPPKKKDQDNS